MLYRITLSIILVAVDGLTEVGFVGAAVVAAFDNSVFADGSFEAATVGSV